MSCSTKFKHNPICDLSGNEQNCSTNQRPGNSGNLLECNKNLVRPGDALSEFAHPFWVKSNQLFVCRCTATAQRVRGQGMAGIHWSKTKSQSGQERSTMKLLGCGVGGGWGGVGWSWGGVGVGGGGVGLGGGGERGCSRNSSSSCLACSPQRESCLSLA